VNLLLSDAGAVSVQVNGKKVKRLGARGEMVRRSFEAPKEPVRR
jgi:hypothetical protein